MDRDDRAQPGHRPAAPRVGAGRAHAQAHHLYGADAADDTPSQEETVPDDRLRLGHVATAGSLLRLDLCAEAIRLARVLTELMPDKAKAHGLLALLLLLHARRAARVAADGSLARLAGQDRRLWDRDPITEGQAIVRACVQRDHPGPFQLEAAINAVHSIASSFDSTDWHAILTLDDQLYALTPTPVVALNRAVALAEVRGQADGLAAADKLRTSGRGLDGYYLFHAARAACCAASAGTRKPRRPTPPPARMPASSRTQAGLG
jgi:predicted RNA polymerase sigma factor